MSNTVEQALQLNLKNSKNVNLLTENLKLITILAAKIPFTMENITSTISNTNNIQNLIKIELEILTREIEVFRETTENINEQINLINSRLDALENA